MKKLILIFCAIIPLLSFGQTDKKYLEPLPTKDGRITFETQLKAPSLSQQELYDILYKWADERFKPNGKMNSRVVFTDKDNGTFVVSAEEYMIFSSSLLSLDRTRIYYQLQVDCTPENIKIQMGKIRYWYDEANDGGERFKAEEWISDKSALNKARTRLLPISGKFRRKTIDLNEELIKSVHDIIAKTVLDKRSSEVTASQVVVAPQIVVSTNKTDNTVSPEKGVENSNSNVISETKVEDKSISNDNIIAQSNRITITSGNDEQFEIGKESWGGFGKLFGKNVTFCLIDTQKTMANMLLSQNDIYTISFFVPGKSEPALVLKCRKISVQTINGEEANKMNAKNSTSQKYNMYVGEVE